MKRTLILDTCAICNLLNVFQDYCYVKLLNKVFDKVTITKEVLNEITNVKKRYLIYFNNDYASLNQLYVDASLESYISEHNEDKKECTPFFSKYASKKRLKLKSNGEYYSSLLALYSSRLGVINFNENLNLIIFATDDLGAHALFSQIFHINQIGKIITSVDLMIILYLNDLVTHKKVIDYIDGVISMQNHNINKVIKEAEKLKSKFSEPKFQIFLTTVIEHANEFEVEKLNNLKKSKTFLKINKSTTKLGVLIDKTSGINITSVKRHFIELRNDIKDNLIWNPS